MGDALANRARVCWIDCARCIGIFLVVWGHLPLKDYGFFSIENLIYAFHMPLFFFLAGLTHKDAGVKETLKNGARRLLIPYAVFYIIDLVYYVSVAIITRRGYAEIVETRLIKGALGMIVGCGYDTFFSKMLGTSIWFLLGLFWCGLLFSAAETAFKRGDKTAAQIVLCAVLLTLAFVMDRFDFPLMEEKTVVNSRGWEIKQSYAVRFAPFSLGTVTLSYVFFFAGSRMKNRLLKGDSSALSKKKRIAITALSFAALAAVSVLNGKCGINGISFGADLFLFLAGAALGIVFIYELSALVSPAPRFFAFMGRNSLAIMALHAIPRMVLERVILKTPDQEMSFGLSFAFAAVNFILCAIPAFIIEKYFPFVIGKKKKKISVSAPSERTD